MKRKQVKLQPYYEKKNYHLLMDGIVIVSFILSFISLIVAFLVRSDTEELTKLTDKPIYYDIYLQPNKNSDDYEEHERYITLDMNLIVDDFKIYKQNFLKVNYNAVFTHIKYFLVYDYSLSSKEYKYMRYTLDDKTTAKLRLEDAYVALPTRLNYALTPNKNYAYILIDTETTSEENLDLLFFSFNVEDGVLHLDTIEDGGKTKIDARRVDYDTYISRDYFEVLWSQNDSKKQDDIAFMFDVYEDLLKKLKDKL